jgi:HSP20 family molecular chaperone IbpA
MDVPGISEDEIEMYRQNVVTIVKGNRKRPYPDQQTDQVERQERKYGEFTLSFKIPENFERKWSYFGVENGVLKIVYEKDKDDLIPSKYMQQG